MINKKTLEQRVNEDLMSDSPPLYVKEYEEYIKRNFIYYAYNYIGQEEPKYFNRGKEISFEEIEELRTAGNRPFHFQVFNKHLGYELDTNNAHLNIPYRRTPQLEKFRGYLRKNYLKFSKEYLPPEREQNPSQAYTIKAVLILENYNKNVSEEDKVIGVEG